MTANIPDGFKPLPIDIGFIGVIGPLYLRIRDGDLALGFRVEELPVTRAYPARGAVPTKIRGLRGNLAVLGTLASACLGRVDPPCGRRAA